MAICSIAQASKLRSSFVRMDPEFFKPVYMQASQEIEDVPGVVRLGHICERVTQGSNPKFSRSGMPCVNGKNVYFGTMLAGEPNYVTPAEFERLRGYVLRKDDLVITLKHATKIGRVWLVEDNEPRIFSRNVGLIRLAPGVPYLPSIVLLYLWSRHGQLLLDRCATGGTTGQITLPITELKRLPIPPFADKEQKSIDAVFKQSRSLAREARDLFAQAEDLLDAELPLNHREFEKPIGYLACLSDAVVGARIDSEYFQPQYVALRKTVQSYKRGHDLLSQVADALKPNIDPSQAPTNDFNYVELSQINSALGMIEGHTQSSGAGLPTRARRQVSAGDVIASAVVGSVDKVALISTGEDDYIASTGFFHFRPKTVSPEYLLMLVRSRCVSMQFQQQATGGILSAVPDGRLKYVIVPRFPQKLQDKVTDLVAQAHQAKRKSDALLEKAKARVEQLIEEAIEQ